jgi:hypothetical protein
VSPLRAIYLGLAIWGAIQPTRWNALWVQENGWGFGRLLAGWHANAATTALTWDLTIAAIALSVWALAETRVRRNWQALWAIPATFLIGLSCGLPLYLYLRTRPVT